MAIESDKEAQQLKNHIRDLAEKAFRQNIYTFSGFLGLSEQHLFWQLEPDLRYVSHALWGGTESAERKLLRFGSPEELGYEEEYPITCIHVEPLQAKFAEALTHRDFLGALMNLGIERSTIGDIRAADKEGYLFCLSGLAEFICDHLDKIRHTNVRCRIVERIEELPEEAPQAVEEVLSSLRIDVCLAKVYNKSRSDILECFRSGRVYVDGRLCENNARLLKGGEVVNLRGFGKFVFSGETHETRKGKICAKILLYK